jgi:hypothetical protein
VIQPNRADYTSSQTVKAKSSGGQASFAKYGVGFRAHKWPVLIVPGAVAIAAVVFVFGLLVGAGIAPRLLSGLGSSLAPARSLAISLSTRLSAAQPDRARLVVRAAKCVAPCPISTYRPVAPA